jgi:hypothetical protein
MCSDRNMDAMSETNRTGRSCWQHVLFFTMEKRVCAAKINIDKLVAVYRWWWGYAHNSRTE